MQDVVPDNVDILGYADDHALKKSFSANSRTDEQLTMSALEGTTKDIKEWMDTNRLKMNNDKTEFILMGSRQQLKKAVTTGIDVNGVLIKRNNCICYLGADLDENLWLKSMIHRKCRSALENLQKLIQIRRNLNIDAAKSIALGLVIVHLDYANALYTNLPTVHIKKLQRIQTMTAKVVTGAARMDSGTGVLKQLPWLPIHLRVKYKILISVFRALHDLATKYLCDLLEKPSVRKPGLRSESGLMTLSVPMTKSKTFAERSFGVYGPKHWNTLPESLRTVTDITTFKKELKTHLFRSF